MHKYAIRHGCLAGLCATTAALGAETRFSHVQTRVFDIEYAVNNDALPLDTVRMWYTLDEGRSWHPYGYDEDRQSPLRFQAPSDGLFGFYFRVTNLAGISGAVPSSSTKPQARVFVDSVEPVVQLHKVRQTSMLGRRVVQLRWTAVDSHLTTRPIEFEYRNLPKGMWISATPNPLANTGRFDWRVPIDVIGALEIRLVVRDKGAHRVVSAPQSFTVSPPRPAVGGPSSPTEAFDHNRSTGTTTRKMVSFSTQDRALELYKKALAFGEMNDPRRGIAQMREAVKLNPLLTDGFAELGRMLYGLGDLERALTAYEIALDQQPTLRKALHGSAKVYRQKKDYGSAARRLRSILRYNPKDAETWMNLGDIGIFQGDELLARECYVRAAQIDDQASDVIEQAQKRLALMAEVSRSYQQKKNP
ncbi:MAG: tetratricopeptide repeat protein [Planctomycetes bacterium]|nr:tetratricopeptide repeat protein [Planctomycetota bacterium]